MKTLASVFLFLVLMCSSAYAAKVDVSTRCVDGYTFVVAYADDGFGASPSISITQMFKGSGMSPLMAVECGKRAKKTPDEVASEALIRALRKSNESYGSDCSIAGCH